jgi:hypothetical protein
VLWDAATGREVRRLALPARGRAVSTNLAFSPDGRTLALTSARGAGGAGVQLLEVGSGSLRHEFAGHHGLVTQLVFSADGKVLASGSFDTTVLLWDVYGLPGSPAKWSAAEGAVLWSDLDNPDGTIGFRALRRLLAAPEATLPLLRAHLRPAERVRLDAKKVERLIAQLDDDEFVVRDRATRDLEEIGVPVRAALVKALAGRPSVEQKKRLQGLLDRLARDSRWREKLRPGRVLEVLEQVGTPGARKLLGELAGGDPEAWLTQEAQKALRRAARP